VSELQTSKRILRAGRYESLRLAISDCFLATGGSRATSIARVTLHRFSLSSLPGKHHLFILWIFALLLSGCAVHTPFESTCYLPDSTGNNPLDSIAGPVFLVENSAESYNRIGSPAARISKGGETEIYVDPSRPTLFVGETSFTTDRGHYRNLIYRIHFSEVPVNFPLLNLTAGNNPGLLFIYTFDEDEKLVLITTVHTCGCYLAFLPTDQLEKSRFPENWPQERQWIYGHYLPSILPLPHHSTFPQILFTIGDQTHRIKAIQVFDGSSTKSCVKTIPMPQLPLVALHALPFGEATTSFFYPDGPKQGYVRNNKKILERLFISWWAFDLYVGEDKEYGSNATEPVFYTSLKFWQRQSSDLRDFPNFLHYWGWDL
jgi:hypothetical protein